MRVINKIKTHVNINSELLVNKKNNMLYLKKNLTVWWWWWDSYTCVHMSFNRTSNVDDFLIYVFLFDEKLSYHIYMMMTPNLFKSNKISFSSIHTHTRTHTWKIFNQNILF